MTWKQMWLRLWAMMGVEMATWQPEDREKFIGLCRQLAANAEHPADRRRFENYADVAERVHRGEPAVV